MAGAGVGASSAEHATESAAGRMARMEAATSHFLSNGLMFFIFDLGLESRRKLQSDSYLNCARGLCIRLFC